jgi:deoxyribose-phosphate aldolase
MAQKRDKRRNVVNVVIDFPVSSNTTSTVVRRGEKRRGEERGGE